MPFAAGGGFSPETVLLPYLEQAALYNSVNFTDVLVGPGRWQWAEALSPTNSTALALSLAVYQCPSDDSRLVPGNDYRACTGATPFDKEFVQPSLPGGDGAFVTLKTLTAADFMDGLSLTVGFSERVTGSDKEDATPSARDVNFRDRSRPITGPPPPADEFMRNCAMGSGPELGFMRSGQYWLPAGFRDGIYNHVMGPNATVVDCTTAPPSTSMRWISQRSRREASTLVESIRCSWMEVRDSSTIPSHYPSGGPWRHVPVAKSSAQTSIDLVGRLFLTLTRF